MDELLIALRAAVALAAVLGLLLWIGRRVQKGQAPTAAGGSGALSKRLAGLWAPRPGARAGMRRPAERITVVARAGLGGRAQLVVAEFGGIRYVLGVSEHGVNVVDTQEVPEEDAREDPETPRGASAFSGATGAPAAAASAGIAHPEERGVPIFPDRALSRRQVRQRDGYRTPPLSR